MSASPTPATTPAPLNREDFINDLARHLYEGQYGWGECCGGGAQSLRDRHSEHPPCASVLEARRITGVLLDAALPLIFAELAKRVRIPEGEPGNPFSYEPSDDDSVDVTDLTEVVHAAVEGALPWGEWLARTRAADFIAGGSIWPAAE